MAEPICSTDVAGIIEGDALWISFLDEFSQFVRASNDVVGAIVFYKRGPYAENGSFYSSVTAVRENVVAIRANIALTKILSEGLQIPRG